MSLQFIFGNSGSGKSYYLYNYIVKESIKHPDRNYLVIVPEQFTMQTQKDLCLIHPRGGIMNIDVLSFARLAHRIFEETGAGRQKILDDEGKNLILRKIAGNYEQELKVLRGNLKKQGYISEVKSVISEFTQYGIGVEALDSLLETLDMHSYLYYKLQDIRQVYEGFESYLADKYITKEELLDVLSGVARKSKILKDSVIALDGFTGFTPVQDRLLGELLGVCRKLLITVEMDQRENPFIYRHPYQLFALSKQMVASLTEIARRNQTEIEEPVTLYEKPIYRFRQNPALGFLEAELFRYSRRRFEKEQDAVSLHAIRNPMEEAKFVAARIRRLVRRDGYRYKEMAVICSDMEVYASHLEKAFQTYEIPFFMDHKKSILQNAFVEYIRGLLSMVEQSFTYESVFRFLRTGLTDFTKEETDKLENYVLAVGIKGWKKWQEVWARCTVLIQKEELSSLNHLRVRFVEQLENLTFVLKQRSKTVRDITQAVYEFLVQENMQEKLKELEQNFQKSGELALAKEYSQVYRITLELFDKFVELLGDEKISLKEYCELLDAGLEEAKVGVIPPSLDQVVIGDVERTRLKNIKVLFFIGVNDTLLPGNLGAGGLLSERDRERLQKEKITLSPGAKEKTYIQKFYLYMNLTKPTEKLILSYSKASADGKSLRPAYLVQDIRKLFPALQIMEEEEGILKKELTKKTGLSCLAEGLRERKSGIDREWKELYSWYVREEKDEVENVLNAAFYRHGKEKLTEEQARLLYGEKQIPSVTRLEKFAACAYAHFLSYGLKISQREEYRFEALDWGNIAHRSMERFSRKAQERNQNWKEIDEETKGRLVEESVEESILDYGNTVLYSSARNEYLITRIKKLIRRSVWALTKQMECGDFVPSGYELNFGSGKIDRIDTCEEDSKVYVKVTDYKTGMKSFDITAFCHGLQLQLPVYLNAALDVEKKKNPGKEVIPAGIFYYRMQDPIVEKEENEEKLEEKLLKELKLDGIINADEEVLEHMEHDLKGTSRYFPIGRNKDGGLSKNSRVLSPEEFSLFLDYAEELKRHIYKTMQSGETTAAPYVLGTDTGCDYCAYHGICGFDPRVEGCEYRRLEKYSKEDALEQMKKAGGKTDERNMDTGTAESN